MKKETEFLLNQVEFNNPELKPLLEFCLDKAPEHFWTMPSSSTGKHHPPDENGKGGLVLHTIRVLKVANKLMECWNPPFITDAVKLASALHDIGRYGLKEKPSNHSLPNHPKLGAKFLENCIKQFHPNTITIVQGTKGSGMTLAEVTLEYKIRVILTAKQAILTHMGK